MKIELETVQLFTGDSLDDLPEPLTVEDVVQEDVVVQVVSTVVDVGGSDDDPDGLQDESDGREGVGEAEYH